MTQLMESIRNGVDTAQMYGTLDAIKAQPELGVFQFRASNHWIDGAHNRTTIQRLLRRRPGGHLARRAVHRSTRASRRSCSAPTPAPTPPSTCCTRSPRA